MCKKIKDITLIYELAEGNNELVSNAFDILFEETLKRYGDLTFNDN